MTAFERSTLGPLTLLGSGGQGNVYHAPRARMNYAPAVAFKEYRPAERAKVDFGALEAMAAFLGARTFEEGSWLVGHVAWPAFVVTDGGSPVGFLMAEVPDDFRTTIRRPSGATERTLAQVQLLLNPSSYLAKRGIGLSDRHRYRLLAEVAETLGVLGGHGIAVGEQPDTSIANRPPSSSRSRRIMMLNSRLTLPREFRTSLSLSCIPALPRSTPRRRRRYGRTARREIKSCHGR